jgi:hypothetical protein
MVGVALTRKMEKKKGKTKIYLWRRKLLQTNMKMEQQNVKYKNRRENLAIPGKSNKNQESLCLEEPSLSLLL